jgi:calcineurin-like phosphoesterase family protein
MSRDIWLISDTHFGHANILNFTDRDGNLIRGARFSSVEEMNETMVENWNKTVKPGDLVYHLGDVFMGPKEDFLQLWKRLNGSKRLVLGNHDDAKFFVKNELVTKVVMWREFHEHGLLLTHVPIDPSGLWRYRHGAPDNDHDGQVRLLNIHGHIHQNPSPTEHHRCVCVEHIDYTPIHIEELRVANNR